MKNSELALTEESVAYLGVYEELYDLYENCQDALCDAYMELKKKKTTIWPKDINEKARGKIRKLFEGFLKANSFIFTDEGYTLHPDAVFLDKVDLWISKKTGVFSFEYTFCSFLRFLNMFEIATNDRMIRWKEKEQKHNFLEEEREKYFELLNEKIKLRAIKAKQQQIVNGAVNCELCKEIVVYDNLKTISCNQKQHVVKTGFCICVTGKEGKKIKLPAHICHSCGKCFIGLQTLKIYENIYGDVVVKRVTEAGSMVDFGKYAESDLHKTGYNVREGGMTDLQRKNHLKTLVETNIMQPFEIIRDIEFAIRLFNGQSCMEKATRKWKRDLLFINEYAKGK